MSGKQWAGRLVAIVQLACWCAVSGLLLNRGISNLTMHQEQVAGRPARGFTAGVIMVSVSSIMLLLSPTFLLMKIIDMRRRRRILLQLAEGDVPPSYDDVVERAPTYSSLFLVSESGEVRLLNESGPGATIVPRRPIMENAPRYSSLFIVTESGEVLEKNANRLKDDKATEDVELGETAVPEEVEQLNREEEEEAEDDDNDEEVDDGTLQQLTTVNISC